MPPLPGSSSQGATQSQPQPQTQNTAPKNTATKNQGTAEPQTQSPQATTQQSQGTSWNFHIDNPLSIENLTALQCNRTPQFSSLLKYPMISLM